MNIPLRLTAVFEESKEGHFIGYFEDLPDVMAEGDTLDETKAKLAAAYQTAVGSGNTVDVTARKRNLTKLFQSKQSK